MSKLFVTILVDLTPARVSLDIQAMAKIALVSYFHITKNAKSYWLKTTTTTLRNGVTLKSGYSPTYNLPIACKIYLTLNELMLAFGCEIKKYKFILAPVVKKPPWYQPEITKLKKSFEILSICINILLVRNSNMDAMKHSSTRS